MDKTPTINSGTNMPVSIQSVAIITTGNKDFLYNSISVQLNYRYLKSNLSL